LLEIADSSLPDLTKCIVRCEADRMEGCDPMQQQSNLVAAILFGGLGLLVAWLALAGLPADTIQRFRDSIDLVALVLGFIATVSG
jgi:uncharacterized membrane protein YqjE